MKTTYKTRFIGFLLIVGGITFLGEQLGFWNFSIFFPGWWTVFLILPAIFSMIDSGFHVGNSILLLLGAYFLLNANDWISFRLTLGAIVALFCILFGMQLIFGSSRTSPFKEKEQRFMDDEDSIKNIHSNVCFSTRRVRAKGIVNSLDAQCLFGTQLIDLSEADIRDMQYCRVDNVFGTVDVIVRDDINFVVKRDNVFGSCNIQDEPSGIYDLYVNISCVFGQVRLRKIHIEEDILEGKFKEKH